MVKLLEHKKLCVAVLILTSDSLPPMFLKWFQVGEFPDQCVCVFCYWTERSIGRTWAQVEDADRRELLLQAFRQRCEGDRQTLTQDIHNISKHRQTLEQLARSQWAIYMHLPPQKITFQFTENNNIWYYVCVWITERPRSKCCLEMKRQTALQTSMGPTLRQRLKSW